MPVWAKRGVEAVETRARSLGAETSSFQDAHWRALQSCQLRERRRLGGWDHSLHLVRVRTFRAARVDGCHNVVIRLSGLNGSVNEGSARIGRSNGGVGPAGNARPIHVVPCHIRGGTRVPGQIYAVLNRRHSASTQRLCYWRICRVANKRQTGYRSTGGLREEGHGERDRLACGEGGWK